MLSKIILIALLSLASANFHLGETIDSFQPLNGIPIDPNFTVTNFIGDWNIVGLYGLDVIAPRSCPSLTVDRTLVQTLSLTITFINETNSTFETFNRVYEPNPLNKGLLVDIFSTFDRQNLAVSYYNDTAGLALLINMNGFFAIALSKGANIYEHMFMETVNDIFIQAGFPLNRTTPISDFGCETRFTPADNFDSRTFRGIYYGNAIFTYFEPLLNLTCYNLEVQPTNNSHNHFTMTQWFQKDGFKFNFTSHYLASPDSPAFLIDIHNEVGESWVVNFYDPINDVYVILAHDGVYAFIVSSQQTLDDRLMQALKNLLGNEGLNLTNGTFYVLPTACTPTFQEETFLRYD